MTHLNLHQALNRMPQFLEERFITDDFVYIDIKYIRLCESKYNYDSTSDEYLLTITSPWNKVPTTYRIYVPLYTNGNCNYPEYNKIIAQIEPTIAKDYENYKEKEL